MTEALTIPTYLRQSGDVDPIKCDPDDRRHSTRDLFSDQPQVGDPVIVNAHWHSGVPGRIARIRSDTGFLWVQPDQGEHIIGPLIPGEVTPA